MKKNLRTILIATLFVLLFVSMTISSVLSKQFKPVPEGTIGNTAGNAYNGGMFCEYDGVVYFSNPYDGNTLYSMSPDETHMKKLINARVSNLNAGGSYLFYYQQGVNGSAGLGYLRSVNGLYRASLDGKKPTCLAQDVVFNVQLIGNALYYLSSDKNDYFIL